MDSGVEEAAKNKDAFKQASGHERKHRAFAGTHPMNGKKKCFWGFIGPLIAASRAFTHFSDHFGGYFHQIRRFIQLATEKVFWWETRS